MDSFFDIGLFENRWFLYGFILMLLFPLLLILSNELIYKLKRRDKRLAAPISLFRNVIIPFIALIVIFTQVIGYSRGSTSVKLIETVIWILAINTLLAILNVVFFSGGEKSIIKAKVPQLFLDIFRVMMVLLGAAIVLSTVWGVDLGGMMTALGLGSFVLGLALQDTLGNLFSGIALVYEKPFSEGDVIKVGDSVGKVVEMNWRAIRLLTREEVLIVIPHLVIGQESIENYSKPQKAHVLKTLIGFSYDVPPNKVKEALMKTCLSTPGILHDPEPEVKTSEYGRERVVYEVEFAIEEYQLHEEVMDDFMSRVWYTAKREKIQIPLPQMQIQNVDHVPHNELITKGLEKELNKLPQMLPIEKSNIETIKPGSSILHFGKGEYVIKQGDATGALYVIMKGSAIMLGYNDMGNEERISSLDVGDFFGEITLFTAKESSFSILAIEDLEVVAISPEEVVNMIENNQKLAHYLDNMMDARRKLVDDIIKD